ncbi:MAG: hypothetical protein DRP79_04245, partial [Planctomycetota bacterium]
MKNMTDIIDIAQDITVLKPMPASIRRLAEVAGDPEAGIDEIEEAIKFDQTLTAYLLRMANSAWSGSSRQIETIRQAI